MIREAFRTVLLTDSAVAEAVGSRRVYPLMMPQGERDPSLVYQRIGGVPDITLEGPGGVRETVLQLAAWALNPDDAAHLIDLAEHRLDGFSGMVPISDDSPPLIADIRGIFRQRERDGYDKDAKLFHDSRDFSVMWCPAT